MVPLTTIAIIISTQDFVLFTWNRTKEVAPIVGNWYTGISKRTSLARSIIAKFFIISANWRAKLRTCLTSYIVLINVVAIIWHGTSTVKRTGTGVLAELTIRRTKIGASLVVHSRHACEAKIAMLTVRGVIRITRNFGWSAFHIMINYRASIPSIFFFRTVLVHENTGIGTSATAGIENALTILFCLYVTIHVAIGRAGSRTLSSILLYCRLTRFPTAAISKLVITLYLILTAIDWAIGGNGTITIV